MYLWSCIYINEQIIQQAVNIIQIKDQVVLAFGPYITVLTTEECTFILAKNRANHHSARTVYGTIC